MRNTEKHIVIIMLAVAGFFNLQRAYPQSETFENVAFKAMQDQIDKNLANLKLDKLKSPYYVGYLITDANLYAVETKMGGVVRTIDKPFRNQETSVMVGDNKRNNLNFISENKLFGWYGASFSIPLPMENSYEAITRTLWAETDAIYKDVAELMEAKLTALSQQNLPQEEVNLIDYSAVPITNVVLPSQKISFDKTKIDALTKELSAVFTSYSELTNSGVNTYIFDADAFFLSSEKIKYKIPFSLICIRIYAEAVAVDGEPLLDYVNLYFKTPDQIPAAEVLKKEVNQLASMLTQLRKAPSVNESYSGPVMFEGQAVGELIAQCFVDNPNGLLASRKPIFSNPALQKNYAQYVPKENNLEQFIGKKVTSRDISISTALNQKQYNNIPLIGYYELDAQGVVPKKNSKIIEDGVLKSLLTDRIPTLHLAKSSGNSCFAISDGSLTGTLSSGIIEVSISDGKTYKELKDKLIAAAKEEDYEYAYIVRKMTSPMASVPGLSDFNPPSNTGFAVSRPIYVYRISVKDGTEELVRSAKISDVSVKSFKRIIGAASEKQVYNTLLRGKEKYYSTWQSGFDLSGSPSSLIVPQAIVFEELDIDKEKNIVLKKEAVVPNPLK